MAERRSPDHESPALKLPGGLRKPLFSMPQSDPDMEVDQPAGTGDENFLDKAISVLGGASGGLIPVSDNPWSRGGALLGMGGTVGRYSPAILKALQKAMRFGESPMVWAAEGPIMGGSAGPVVRGAVKPGVDVQPLRELRGDLSPMSMDDKDALVAKYLAKK